MPACAGPARAQASPDPVLLVRYTNDSLGFSMDLPCVPTLQPPDVIDGSRSLVCTDSTVTVVILPVRETINNDREFNAFLKTNRFKNDSFFSTRVERTELDGHRARHVIKSSAIMQVDLLIVADRDLVLIIGLSCAPWSIIDPKILQSVDLH